MILVFVFVSTLAVLIVSATSLEESCYFSNHNETEAKSTGIRERFFDVIGYAVLALFQGQCFQTKLSVQCVITLVWQEARERKLATFMAFCNYYTVKVLNDLP